MRPFFFGRGAGHREPTLTMAEYTFLCPACQHVEVIHRAMQDGPPSDLTHCGQAMVRQYRPLKAVTFNAAHMLVDYYEHNYNLMRLRKCGIHAPRFSPDHVTRPGKPIPGQNWNRK